MTVVNYNDGKWHVHNSGEFPVNARSRGDITYADGTRYLDVKLGDYTWGEPLMFRVTKEHKEPREFWVAFNDKGEVAGYSEHVDELEHKSGWTCALFREVLQ